MARTTAYSTFGFAVRTDSVKEPRVATYSVDAASAPLYPGDPVKQVSGGRVTRCAPTDSAILGWVSFGNVNTLPASIGVAPVATDQYGFNSVQVLLADDDLMVTIMCAGATSQALMLQGHDLAYAALSTQPTIANVGTAGGTTYSYTIVARTPMGTAPAGTAGQTTTGNASLSAANYNTVTIPTAGTLVSSYDIYRGGLFLVNVAAVVGANTVYNDNGSAPPVTGTSAPTINTTGWVLNQAATSTQILQIVAFDPRDPIGTVNGRVEVIVPKTKSQYGGTLGS